VSSGETGRRGRYGRPGQLRKLDEASVKISAGCGIRRNAGLFRSGHGRGGRKDEGRRMRDGEESGAITSSLILPPSSFRSTYPVATSPGADPCRRAARRFKLQVHSKTEAVAKALRERLI
jgi:hypothetical protein